jgi:broad specificity phosphatase PhoE
MLTFYFVRHGETEWNREKRMQGWLDSELTEKGVHDALALGHQLKDIPFTAVYSSPSARAKKTAKIILEQNRSRSIISDDRLKEIFLANWQGKTIKEIEREDPEAFDHYFYKPHLYRPKMGESFYDVQNRAVSFIKDKLAKHSSGNILVVSHGILLTLLLFSIKKLPLEKLWREPLMEGTSLTIVNVKDRQYQILTEGNTEHLHVKEYDNEKTKIFP